MKVVIRPEVYPPFSSVLKKHEALLKLSRKVLDAHSIQVEEVYGESHSPRQVLLLPTVTTLAHVYRLAWIGSSTFRPQK